MKKTLLVLVMVAMLGMITAGCGKIVEQNEIALVFKTLGDRDVKVAGGKDIGDNFTAELISATRAPLETPDIKILRFPKGVQHYEFSGRPSMESPSNEELCVDAEGGNACFDVVVHMFIDETFPDLKERLVKFTKAYQLRKYSGQPNVLSKFIAGRFRQILRQPFVQYTADKKALEIVRNKKEINDYVREKINERFNDLGIRFPLVAISSAVRVSKRQQERMNEIVIQDVKRRILKLKNEFILPLTKEIAETRLEGKVGATKIINQAKAGKIGLITTAEKERRKLFIDLIGRKNYVEFETMLNMVGNLEGGKTRLTIVPDDSKIILGQPSSPVGISASGQ